ncbi:hypothetical protein MGYG_01013 [Nannizzia gypsea CBS 118893]|uniref:Uncharacterized protein n=1 Tax=Arthroderma gypseum (strain ATCC MYA-4604 / CBS 118893) TaxID=535722 RepID=E5R3R7_ARTGP|nr:hypothetical protein MGYG_01013 [Nannizzia gypsea CBS 118893]EFQ97977.1 hypothetical protein MGYG_01013 [Nannizzia gypsea CBS 118893]
MAVPGNPSFRSLGAGSANVYAAARQYVVFLWPVSGSNSSSSRRVEKLSTGHQPGSLICDIDRTGGGENPSHIPRMFSPNAKQLYWRQSRWGEQLSSKPCCLVNTWRDQSLMERMQLRRLFGLGLNTYLAETKRPQQTRAVRKPQTSGLSGREGEALLQKSCSSFSNIGLREFGFLTFFDVDSRAVPKPWVTVFG